MNDVEQVAHYMTRIGRLADQLATGRPADKDAWVEALIMNDDVRHAHFEAHVHCGLDSDSLWHGVEFAASSLAEAIRKAMISAQKASQN